MLPPAVDALYDAFTHPRAECPSLPLLPPVEARAYDHENRGRVLDLIEHTPADELFTAAVSAATNADHEARADRSLDVLLGKWALGSVRPSADVSRSSRSFAGG
jgi:gamma-glutamyl hercynylcysteine S-oxide synthase